MKYIDKNTERRDMFKEKALIITLSLMLLLNSKTFAKTTTMEELEDLSLSRAEKVDKSKIIDKNHWAYKTLEDITIKYGLLMGKPCDKFNGTGSFTRNEAAFILVNLVGKIEKDQLELSEVEKTKMDILKQELKEEITQLTSKVATLETSVETLKGNVSKLEEADKKEWKFDYGEKFKITGGLQAQYTGNIQKGADQYPSNFALPYSEINFKGQISKHINGLAQLIPTRMFNSSENGILREAYISTDIIPHHTVYFGQTMVPIGYEGPIDPLCIETIDKSQISRKLTDMPDLGIKAEGNWDYLSYSVGGYNGSGQNTFDNSGNMAVSSWAVLKPLYKYPNLGNLEMGGGYYTGSNQSFHRNIASFYSGYRYKRYAIWGEYALADGYQNADQKARSFYIHNSFYLTKKLQLIARYDQFNPDTGIKRNLNTEYTIGTNYLLTDNVGLMLGLVQVVNQKGKNSQRIEALTQYLF